MTPGVDSGRSADMTSIPSTPLSGITVYVNASTAVLPEDQPPYWDLTMTIILSCSMVIFWIFAFFGNIMVLNVILRHRSMRTRTNMFIANLAIADFMVTLFNMPFSLGTVIAGDWPFGDILCQVNGFFMPWLLITSNHTLMYISLHKYFTITYPFRRILSFRRVIILCCVAWIIPGIISFLTVKGLNHVEYKPYTTQCGPAYPTDAVTYAHSAIITLTTYIIPVSVMVFCYSKMFIEIKAYSQRLEQNTNQDRQTILTRQKRALITLLIVIAVFLLCWTPYTIYAVSSSIIKDKLSVPHNANAIVYWLGYMNSACNPIIYGFRNRSFRDGYKEFFCQKWDAANEANDAPLSNVSHVSQTPNSLRRMASTLSQKLNQSSGHRIKMAVASNHPLQNPSIQRQMSSSKSLTKKSFMSDGSVAYLKQGKIVKIDYRKAKNNGVHHSHQNGCQSVDEHIAEPLVRTSPVENDDYDNVMGVVPNGLSDHGKADLESKCTNGINPSNSTNSFYDNVNLLGSMQLASNVDVPENDVFGDDSDV